MLKLLISREDGGAKRICRLSRALWSPDIMAGTALYSGSSLERSWSHSARPGTTTTGHTVLSGRWVTGGVFLGLFFLMA